MNIRVILAGALLTFSAQALSQDIDGWKLYDDDEAMGCSMVMDYPSANGQSTAFEIEESLDDEPMIILRRSGWTMPTQDTTAQIWYSREYDGPADQTVKAQFHNIDGVTHVDVFAGYDVLESLPESEFVVVKLADGNVFERYNVGKSSAAIEEFDDCMDYYFFDY